MSAGAEVRLAAKGGSKLISIVVPAFDEEDVLAAFHERLRATMDALPYRWEVVYVNDGSRDGTIGILERLQSSCPEVAVVELSRNFGKDIALTAGLDHAAGDAVVTIDADLQDPPELIGELVHAWAHEGYDVVYARRIARKGETWLKRATSFAFYRVISRIGSVPIPLDTGDFRLLSRQAADAVRGLRERHRFMKGLFAWVGFRQKGVYYERDARFAGRTKWDYWKLWNFAIEGLTSFTIAPLKLATYLGLAVAVGAFAYGAIIVYRTLVFGGSVAGYPSLMVTILFLGGVQLITLGTIGEYLGRVFDETKGRPLYLCRSFRPAAGRADADRIATAATGARISETAE